MPVKKVKNGWKYGKKGKVYRTKAAAAKQGRAIQANKTKRFKKKKC